jgi:regulatory protein
MSRIRTEGNPQKKFTPSEALARAYRYCAYQERSHAEVRNKLYEFGLSRNDVDATLSTLITEGYLNEERFAKAFAGGKFRMKKWGRLRIINELESHGLTKNCIRAGLKEIDEADYRNTLTDLLQKKSALLSEDNEFVKRDKLSKYVIQKGFEPDLVWQILKEIFPQKSR